MSTLKPLRPHQQTAINLLKSSLTTGHRRPMLQAPTGSGKTVIAAHIVNGALLKNKRLTFVVPALSLIDQTFERFVENGIDPAQIGVIQANHPWHRPHAPIQIATAQTLARRDLPDSDFVVVDEAHVRHKSIESWMDGHPDKIFIGLSATPWARGLGRRYDDLLKPTCMADLIEQGHLSQFRVFAPSHPDLAAVRTVAGDYHEGDLADAMSKPELIADIVTTWLQRGRGEPTLCFAVNRAHARAIHDRFAEAGVSVAYIDANTPREEREAIGERLAAREVEIVCNIGTLTTGVDWDVRCLILARPTKSEQLFVQIVGRALRTADGKEFATILDHTDTHLRLGMVTDIDHDELDDGRAKRADSKKREKKLPLPKECLNCTGLIPAGVPQCLSCGAPAPRPKFAEADGDLSEFGGRGQRSKAPSVSDMVRDLGKANVFAQLSHIQLERGRSSGWVAHTYRNIFGVWPRGVSGLKEPSPLVRSYVKSLDIRFAKSREAA